MQIDADTELIADLSKRRNARPVVCVEKLETRPSGCKAPLLQRPNRTLYTYTLETNDNCLILIRAMRKSVCIL